MGRFAQLAFTPAVKAWQERLGSRKAYARQEQPGTQPDLIDEDVVEFLRDRDSFYMASTGTNGWPYVQHRGGPKGFVRVLDEHTLGFADYRGNRQYISLGNLSKDDRVALIFVDYPRQARLKILAHAKVVTRAERPEVFAKLDVPGYDAKVEHAMLLTVEGLDWNCPQHITPRFTEEQINEAVAPLQERLAALEAENSALKAKLAVTK